jgi:hypothetical protein
MKLTVTLLLAVALGISANAQDQNQDQDNSDVFHDFHFRDQYGRDISKHEEMGSVITGFTMSRAETSEERTATTWVVIGSTRTSLAGNGGLDSFSSNHRRPARLKCETLIRWDRGVLEQPPRWS